MIRSGTGTQCFVPGNVSSTVFDLVVTDHFFFKLFYFQFLPLLSFSYYKLSHFQGIRGVWIKMPINLANLIQPAVEVCLLIQYLLLS
jgi:hypothetical protein